MIYRVWEEDRVFRGGSSYLKPTRVAKGQNEGENECLINLCMKVVNADGDKAKIMNRAGPLRAGPSGHMTIRQRDYIRRSIEIKIWYLERSTFKEEMKRVRTRRFQVVLRNV